MDVGKVLGGELICAWTCDCAHKHTLSCDHMKCCNWMERKGQQCTEDTAVSQKRKFKSEQNDLVLHEVIT